MPKPLLQQVRECLSLSGVMCDFCNHVAFLAHVLVNREQDVCCLRCACARSGSRGSGVLVLRQQRLTSFQALAVAVADCVGGGKVPRSTLRMEGLTELARLGHNPGMCTTAGEIEETQATIV